ncbi:YpsA SLOG family protein [Acinetobacter sp.]|uniref:YpsA SLOG family protein n=1 Tax=Acinetobacter sp. TaxID=472 RepID=UPI00388FEF3C
MTTLKLVEPHYYGLLKVISGGQTGADRGGIDAAFELGVPTGGHAPQGWRTSRGAAPELARIGLVQDISAAYPPRTRLNVKNSDATVIVGTRMQSPGSVLTHSLCLKLKKPCKQIAFTENYTNEEILAAAKELAAWIRKKRVMVLNVAGNRDSYASYLHHHMTFKLIQATLLDLYASGQLMVPELQ